jgi:hypothetical protein
MPLGRSGKPGWFEIKCKHQLLVYADCNILGGSVHTIKKNIEALVGASKETGLEVNVDETKYMGMSRDQNAGQSHNIKFDNCSFERWNSSNIWEQPLTNQSSIQEEIKNRLESGNACFHSMQSLLFSSWLSKNLKVMMYRTILLPVVW